MPELPEVEIVCRGLEEKVLDRTVSFVNQRRPDLRIPFPADLAGRLTGRTVVSCRRRAKYVLLGLDNDDVFILHLGMAGRVLLIEGTEPYKPQEHDHLVVRFGVNLHIVFHDPRRFGMVMLIPHNEIGTHKSFAAIGPEPLGNEFSAETLYNKLRGKQTAVKAALLDQKVVAGLGNIYVCEALYGAGISPRRKSANITRKEAGFLVQSIRSVLRKAIAAGGSSLRDYRQADGTLGYFQHHFAVYDRAGEACPDCSCDVSRTEGVRKIVQGGRSTYYCPRRQK